MKLLSPGFELHLSGAVTTLCRCWRVARRDGTIFGFTDHDCDLAFDGTHYEAASGLSVGDMEQTLGLNADSQQASGALVSSRITEADIEADRYDGARIDTFLVNWKDPAQRMLERVLMIGEITREDGLFHAELRGTAALADQTRGRRFSRVCEADLGDTKCTVNLELALWSRSGSVINSDGALEIEVAGLGGVPANHFRGGRINFHTGANAGVQVEIAEHGHGLSEGKLTLWKPPPHALAAGDTFTVRAGCDKRFATCRDRFANQLNFRGFPHIPGNDFALGSAVSFNLFDGGALVP